MNDAEPGKDFRKMRYRYAVQVGENNVALDKERLAGCQPEHAGSNRTLQKTTPANGCLVKTH